MQILIKHIESLLPEHDCVVVPGLGGFVQHEVPAKINPDSQLFYPVIKEIGFNPKLHFNDGLLAQSYQESYGLTFEEANQQIQEVVQEIRAKLEEGKFLQFSNIGNIRMQDGQLLFRPNFRNPYHPESFGLSPFTFPLLGKGFRRYPFVPLLVSEAESPAPWIPRVAPTPFLVLSCKDDQVVPAPLQERIHAMAPGSFLWTAEKCRHIGALRTDSLRKRFETLVDSLSQAHAP